jgi:hypothetical protein
MNSNALFSWIFCVLGYCAFSAIFLGIWRYLILKDGSRSVDFEEYWFVYVGSYLWPLMIILLIVVLPFFVIYAIGKWISRMLIRRHNRVVRV